MAAQLRQLTVNLFANSLTTEDLTNEELVLYSFLITPGDLRRTAGRFARHSF